MSRQFNYARTVLASILVFIGCSSGEPTAVPELAGCTGPVSLSVSAGTVPTFSWTPACKVYYLDVGVDGTSEEIWAVGNFDKQNTMAPGVKFGEVPAATTKIEGPVKLQTGKTYYVFVAFYNNGVESDGGRTTFKP